jgi:hypothetical protein
MHHTPTLGSLAARRGWRLFFGQPERIGLLYAAPAGLPELGRDPEIVRPSVLPLRFPGLALGADPR